MYGLGDVWSRWFPNCCFWAGSQGESVKSPLKVESQFPIAFWVPGHKPHCFSKPIILGFIFPAQFPRVGVPDVRLKHLILQEEAPFLWYFVIFLLLVGRYSTGRGPVETASLPLLPYSMWPFYCLLWKSCSAGPLIIFRENYSTGSCNFGVSLGIGETCVFLSPTFNQFPKLLFPLAFLDSQNIPHPVFSVSSQKLSISLVSLMVSPEP